MSTPERPDSKILRGVDEAFSIRSWTYHVRPDHPPEDAEVLLLGTPVVPRSRERKPGPEAVNPVAGRRPPRRRTHVHDDHGPPRGLPRGVVPHAPRERDALGLGLEPTGAAIADFPEVITGDQEEQDDETPWERMTTATIAVSLSIEDLPPVNKALGWLRTREGEETDLWAAFDTDLLSLRRWRGELGLRGIVYDGPGTFPEIDGEVLLRTAAVPGWVSQESEPSIPGRSPSAPSRARSAAGSATTWTTTSCSGTGPAIGSSFSAWSRARTTRRPWSPSSRPPPVTAASACSIPRSPTDPSARPRAGRARPSRGDATVPAGGTVRVAMAAGEAPPPPRGGPRRAGRGHEGRGRWGAPLITEGVIDVGREDDDGVRRSTLQRGDSMRVAAAAGRRTRLELVGDGRADRTVIIEGAAPVAPGDLTGSPPPKRRRAVARRRRGDPGRAQRGAGAEDLRLDEVTWRRGVNGRALDFDRTAAAWPRTSSSTSRTTTRPSPPGSRRPGRNRLRRRPPDGDWVPDGVTLFLRGGRLTFDVGWVGAVDGGPRIDDGAWHHVATWRAGDEVRLFVDGVRVARGELPLEASRAGIPAALRMDERGLPRDAALQRLRTASR